MRVLAALTLALFVTACDWVVTKTPLFGAGDTVGAPRLHAGVWTGRSETDCKFDERKPIRDWPDCTGRLVIRDGRWMSLDKGHDGRWSWTVLKVLLTGGSPAILETSPEKGDAGYGYYGLRGVARDASGRLTSFELWPVLCGPPAAKSPDGVQQPVRPFPGMTMDANDSDCTTTSKAALRDAADASRLWADTLVTAHWVRSGAS